MLVYQAGRGRIESDVGYIINTYEAMYLSFNCRRSAMTACEAKVQNRRQFAVVHNVLALSPNTRYIEFIVTSVVAFVSLALVNADCCNDQDGYEAANDANDREHK